jgi:hypothetical protein
VHLVLVLKLGVTLFQARKGIVPTKKLFSTLKKLFSLRKKSFSEKIYTPIPHHYLIFTVALATTLCLVRASIIDKQRERERAAGIGIVTRHKRFTREKMPATSRLWTTVLTLHPPPRSSAAPTKSPHTSCQIASSCAKLLPRVPNPF